MGHSPRPSFWLALLIVGVAAGGLLTIPFSLAQPVEPADPVEQATGERMALNLNAIGVPALRAETAASGAGVRIAIVDTGVDPAHPALSRTPNGDPKIVDWVDLSGRGSFADRAAHVFGTVPAEGDVFLVPVAATGASLSTGQGVVQLDAYRSLSGTYRVGTFSEAQLPAGAIAGRDLGADGDAETRFLVVAVDTQAAGVYDTVLIDTDSDGELGDEVPLRPFREEPTFVRLPTEDGFGVSVVVTDLDPEGRLVNLGFDGNGHGTQVAGIAAAHLAGGFQGVAPGAQLIVVKALSSDGEGSWSQILDGVSYATEQGAEIVTISIASLMENEHGAVEREVLGRLARHCGCLIVLAAGNDGPGIDTTAVPATSRGTLIVGAAYTPEMVQWDFGYRPSVAGVWYFSGMGPHADGAVAPNVLAPGRAPATVPFWLSPGGFQMLEGTSAAAPHVAGAAALLLDAARRRGLDHTASQLQAALERGARPLPGYTAVEQGFGVIDVGAAWQWLRRGVDRLPVEAVAELAEPARSLTVRSHGVYLRGQAAGNSAWELALERGAADVKVTATADWLRPDRAYLRLPGGIQRRLHVHYAPPAEPGLYTAWLHLDQGQARASLLHTYVRPLPLTPGEGPVERGGTVEAGRWVRYFIEVPAGTKSLTVELRVPSEQGRPAGLVQLFGYRPDGVRWFAGKPVGAGAAKSDVQRVTVPVPVPGVWEWIVYAPFSGGQQGLVRSHYRIRFEATGLTWQPAAGWIAFPSNADSVQLPLALPTRSAAQLSGLGVGWVWPRTEHLLLSASTSQPAFREFRVEPGTGLLEIVAAAASEEVNVDLYLYRKQLLGGPEPVAQSAEPRTNVERVRLVDPAAGTYIIWVEVQSEQRQNVAVAVSVLPAGDRIHVSRPELGGSAETRTTVRIDRPSGRGRYYGSVAVEDQDGLVGFVPILVDRGLPGTFLAVQVVRADVRSYWLTVGLYARSTLRPVPTTIWIDGRAYAAPRGKVTVRRPLPADAEEVSIRVAPRGYAIATTVVRVAPGELRGLLEVTMPASEHHYLHRKVAEQLRAE